MNTRFPAGLAVAVAVLVAGCGHDSIRPPLPGPPVIACPASVTVRGVAQLVTFAAPTTTGGTAPVSVACTPASGALFNTGTTAVSCAAIDNAGRQSQCALSVTVSPLVLSITRFIAFGDSFTEGQNGRPGIAGARFVDVPSSYPTKLEFLLNAEYPGQSIVVVNRGVGSEQVEIGAQRLPGVLAADRGDALLLLDGYNNLLAQCRPRDAGSQGCAKEIDLVVANLRECIHVARTPAYGIKYIFVSTLTPPGPYVAGMDRRIAADAIVETNTRLSQAVRAEGAILVDPYPLFLGHESAYVDDDGLHLRPAGYQVVAEAFFAAIRTAVTSTLTPGALELRVDMFNAPNQAIITGRNTTLSLVDTDNSQLHNSQVPTPNSQLPSPKVHEAGRQ